jgi:hypothetical protein
MPSQGILFVAAGRRYTRAARRSAASVLRHCPDLPVHLFAGAQDLPDLVPITGPKVFDAIEPIPEPHRRSKLDYLPRTPFEWTLYLDSDTLVTADIREAFRLLERFDLAFGHAHWRNKPSFSGAWKTDLPPSFPQFNSGVILYRRSAPVLALLEDWRREYGHAGFQEDQRTLRELLWHSDLRIATLPPEYNVRFLKYPLFWSRTEARPKILHRQMYHDGPLWFLKNWGRQLGRRALRALGTNAAQLRKRVSR